jgi:hypothetical protein
MTGTTAIRRSSRFRGSWCSVVLATLAFSACRRAPGRDDLHGDEIHCTMDLRVAVVVQISSPTGDPVTAVTAFNRTERPCRSYPRDRATPPTEYFCHEQGGGRYIVRVRTGKGTWTQTVSVGADECHVSDQVTVAFWLDPTIAD